MKSSKQQSFAEIFNQSELGYLRRIHKSNSRLLQSSMVVANAQSSTKPKELAIYAKHPSAAARMAVAKSRYKSERTRRLLRSDSDTAVRHFADMTNEELDEFEETNRLLFTNARSSVLGEGRIYPTARVLRCARKT